MLNGRDVFCDSLTVTSPLEHFADLRSLLTHTLSDAGFCVAFATDTVEAWSTVSPDATDTSRFARGLVRIERYPRAGVVAVSASGQVLTALRSLHLLGPYLHDLARHPHRVTRMDVTADDYTVFAPTEVARVRDVGLAGAVSLTRKGIAPSDVSWTFSLRPDGHESGTVNLGKPSANVSLLVYDKRLERYSKTRADWSNLPERCRYEVRVKNGLPTLHDAYEPASLFFHHLAPSLCSVPADVPAWVPRGDGFTLPDRSKRFASDILVSRVQSSPDLRQLCQLAAAGDGLRRDLFNPSGYGGGLALLQHLVADVYAQESLRLDFPDRDERFAAVQQRREARKQPRAARAAGVEGLAPPDDALAPSVGS